MSARRVYLTENTSVQSLKIHVYLSYQGQTRMAHTHIFSYDEEERGHFIFNNAEQKTGLQQSAQLITNDFTKCLRAQMGTDGLDVENLMKMDQTLVKYFRQNLAQDGKAEGLGLNLVRACSDAIYTAVGKVLTESHAHHAAVYNTKLRIAQR